MGRMGDQNDYSIASDLNGHDVDSQKKYKCNYSNCNAVYLRPSRLQRHIRLHTGERPYKCNYSECTKSYTNSSHLKRHSESHNKKMHKCTECPITVNSLHALRRHYKQIHSEDKISCKECGETFNKKYQLVTHQALHSTPTIYKCNKCAKSYQNVIKFNRHQKIHEKTYPCPECFEVLDTWLLLRVHRKIHVKNYKCDTCGKIFLSKFRLRTHSKIHLEDRVALPCPYINCNRVYFFKFNLDQHVKIRHLDEKFYCDICSMGLMSKQKLIEHIQRHYKPNKKRKKNEGQRKKRKDAGIPKKSVITALIGVNLPHSLEKMVLERETNINDTAIMSEAS